MKPHLKAVIEKLDPIARKALDDAISYTVNHQHAEVQSEHLLQALLQQNTQLQVLLEQQCGLAIEKLLSQLAQCLQNSKLSKNPSSAPTFSPLLVDWLIDGWLITSTNWNQTTLSASALMTYLFMNHTALCHPDLHPRLAIDSQQLLAVLTTINDTFSSPLSEVTASTLAKYTRNITQQARQG